MVVKVSVYSDYICPFCFIGKSRVDRLEKEHAVEVEWKGFEIHPETPASGADMESLGFDENVAAIMRKHIDELARDAGLQIKMPARISNSRLALLVGEFAREQGRFKEYHGAVFKAYWQEGKDIGDPEVIFSITAGIGLDTKELAAYLKNHEATARLDKYVREAREYGVDGVPTFVIGDKMVVGAQPYEVLEQIVEEELSAADTAKGISTEEDAARPLRCGTP
ncbi:MAG: DsbA family oxidoreductase [Chloroflexi bacterium]|nr:DsbA family oxidoreductase [Chloroflexota bacterium]